MRSEHGGLGACPHEKKIPGQKEQVKFTKQASTRRVYITRSLVASLSPHSGFSHVTFKFLPKGLEICAAISISQLCYVIQKTFLPKELNRP